MWFQLVSFTAALVALLSLARLPAAVLIGAMGAAMIVAGRGARLSLPQGLFALAQAVIGCMIARSLTPELFRSIGHHLALFTLVTVSVLIIATLLGYVLARLRVLPGTTALWGAFPGAASVMVLMSESHGADMRLVAFMQYLRVVVVAVVASLVARFFGASGASGAGHAAAWLAPVAWLPLCATLALVALGGLVGARLPMAAAPLLGTLALATLLQDLAGLHIELPQPLLAATYILVGWMVGLRFTREILGHAAAALPRILLSISALIAVCAGLGFVVARLAHLDVLTAYFATSPGGADSIAILTAGTAVDVPLVMSIQIGRSLSVMLLGPPLARLAARLALPRPAPALTGQPEKDS